MALATINNLPANAHARRVTCNMILNASCCPPELSPILERLRDSDWQFDRLDKSELEHLYGFIDEELCSSVRLEYEVDTRSMRDYVFPTWKTSSLPAWFEGRREVDCRLCGHQHNRYEFLARNNSGGNDIWMGSTCIRKYEIVVDGAATAEAAWEALSKAMSVSKKAQSRQAWREEHPDHAEVMTTIENAVGIASQRSSWLYRLLPKGWWQRCKDFNKKYKGADSYYRKNGYLTKKRTEEVWSFSGAISRRGFVVGCKEWQLGIGWHLANEINLFHEAAAAGQDVSMSTIIGGELKHDPGVESAKAHWEKFKADYPGMNEYQRDCIDKLKGMAVDPDDMLSRLSDRQARWLGNIVAEVKDEHAKAAAAAATAAKPKPEIELPF